MAASLEEGGSIVLPSGFVEIRSPSLFPPPQFAAEVVADHRIRQREEFPICARLGFRRKPAPPDMSGRVSDFSIFPLPAHGVNILPSPEETPKQANFLIRSKRRSCRAEGLHFGSRDYLCTDFTDAQKLPKALIF